MAGLVMYSISRPQITVTLCCLSSILEHLFSHLSFVISLNNPSEHSPGSFFTFIYLVLAAGIPTPADTEPYCKLFFTINGTVISNCFKVLPLYNKWNKVEDFSFQWINKIFPFLYDLIYVPFL